MRVHYRPMRLGLCVADGAIEDLRRAVRLTSSLWGGRFNPIIPVGARTRLAKELIRMFKVDLLLPVSRGAAIEALVKETVHLPWSEPHRQMFVEGLKGPMPAFLDVYHPMQAIAEERKAKAETGWGGAHVFPNLLSRFSPSAEPIDDDLLCTMGDYLPKEQGQVDYGAMADGLIGAEFLPINGMFADYW